MKTAEPEIENDRNANSAKFIFAACLCVFFFAVGVRSLVWQNNKAAMAEVQSTIVELYLADAAILTGGDIKGFVTGPNPPSDATILTHPPGYSMLIAALTGLFGSHEALFVFQILFNSLSPVLVFLIALSLFDRTTAILSGILAALAPQGAYYSGVLLPDGLCVVPILFALLMFVKATKNPRALLAIVCGVSLGISCWLRSNAMMLPLFFVASTFILMPKQNRIRFAAVLLGCFILTIAPITIRNYVVFHSFIPLSLGMGHTLVIGIGDADREGRFGLPATDVAEIEFETQRYGRLDSDALYSPDGVERERTRTKVALTVIKNDPFWYLSVVVRRAANMFRLERVPVIAAERDERETTSPALYALNVPLKFIQKAFISAVFLPFTILGLIVLLYDHLRRRKILILLMVPLNYLCFQSLIYTEYRFVQSILYLELIVSSVFIVWVFRFVKRSINERGLPGSQ